jgi:hypothetical protein
MATIKITRAGTIKSGASYAFLSRDAARRASRKATANPGTASYYDPCRQRDVYLGIGDVSALDGTQSLYGRGDVLVKVIEAAP